MRPLPGLPMATLSWYGRTGPASFNVAAQLFHGNGLAVGPAFLPALSSGSNDNLIDENVAALANGNFVVVWVDSLIQNRNTLSTVHAQIYQPNLTRIGGPITVMPQFPGPVSGAAVSPCRMGVLSLRSAPASPPTPTHKRFRPTAPG